MGKVGPGGRIMARWLDVKNVEGGYGSVKICLLYTSDAADE